MLFRSLNSLASYLSVSGYRIDILLQDVRAGQAVLRRASGGHPVTMSVPRRVGWGDQHLAIAQQVALDRNTEVSGRSQHVESFTVRYVLKAYTVHL